MSDKHKAQLEAQLWNIANTLRGKMNADDFRDYILGFIFYKFLSEQLENYVNDKLLQAEDGFLYDGLREDQAKYSDYLTAIREACLDELGYFLRPDELFHNIASRTDFILEDLTAILRNIESSTMGTASEDDFDKLFEDLDLTSTKLGRSEEDKNKLVSQRTQPPR